MIHAMMLLAQAGTTPPSAIGGSGPWLVWGIVALAVALALFFVEVFLPTGGVVGFVAGVAAVAGVVMFFQVNTLLGILSATGCLVALPFLVAFALKIWPDTPFGKWVTLEDKQDSVNHPPPPEAEGPGGGGSGEAQASGKIGVGDTGKTLTPLHPVGTCLLQGRREECLAKHGTIDAGVEVRVVVVEGGEVYVTAVEG